MISWTKEQGLREMVKAIQNYTLRQFFSIFNPKQPRITITKTTSVNVDNNQMEDNKIKLSESIILDSNFIKAPSEKPIQALRRLSSTILKENSKGKKGQSEQQQYLKFGDTIILKSKIQMPSFNNTQYSFQKSVFLSDNQQEMVIIGDLVYQNSFNSISFNTQTIENPFSLYKKCLFKVINPRNEDINQYVLYGQRIVLSHTASDKRVAVNLEIPAQERGAFSVQLTQDQYQNTFLRLLPGSSSKKIGDKINYDELIKIQEDYARQYYLQQDEKNVQAIYASDNGSNFQIQKFSYNSEYYGKLVLLQHQESQQFISITEKKITPYIQMKTCWINSANDQFTGSHQESFQLPQLDMNKMLLSDNFDLLMDQTISNHFKIQSQLLQEINEKFVSFNLFEMQPVNPFVSEEKIRGYRFKSLFTSLYMAVDKNDQRRLSLTQNALNEDTIFYLNSSDSQDQSCFSIQSNISTYIGILPNTKRIHLIDDEDNKPQIFKIVPLEKEITHLLETLNDIQFGILNFYVFLQQWSIVMDKRKQNEEFYVYDYKVSIQFKPQLDQETDHIHTYLEKLYNILQNPLLPRLQQFLREQKIIHLLFVLLKLIDCMMHPQTKRDKERSRLQKMQRPPPSQNQAAYIAYKAMQNIPGIIYKILYFACKSNLQNAKIVLDFDEFLSLQLQSYSEVANLLNEVVKLQGDQVADWVRLLEPLNEIEDNIKRQTVYLQIISMGLSEQTNQVRNQNKVCKELFSQGKSGQSRSLVLFGFYEKAVISLYKEETIQEFLQKNPSLKSLKMMDGEQGSFAIEELNEKISKKSLVLFHNYIVTAIELMANLCKGRNKKSLKKVYFLGMSSTHIINVLKSSQTSMNMKNSYLKLYEAIYIDVDPFLPLSKCQELCFIWSQLDESQKDMKTIQIFNYYIEPTEAGKLTKEFEEKILPILHDFIEIGTEFSDENEDEEISSLEKIRFLTTIVHIIHQSIDFGYLTKDQISKIIKPVLMIFLPFLSQKEKSFAFLRENWLSIFMMKCLKIARLVDTIDELFRECGLLFETYYSIKLNLQIRDLVNYYKRSYDSYQIHQSLNILKKEVMNITNILALNEQRKIMAHQKSGRMSMILAENEVEIVNILVGIYCSNWRQDSKGFEQCKKALFLGLNLSKQWNGLLRQVELINGEKEIQLYMQLNGNSVVGQIFSPSRLEVQISNIITDEDIYRKASHKAEDEKTIEINNQLNKLINRIKDIKIDPYLYRKVQNILRNLKVHKSVLKLFQLQSKEQYRSTYKIVIKFLCLFINKNLINCQEVMSEYDNIICFAQSKYKISKLIGLILTNMECESLVEYQVLYKKIFKIMSDFQGSIERKENIRVYSQLYGSLIAFLSACKFSYDITLKRDFLSNLFKLPFFFQNIQYYQKFLKSYIKNEKELIQSEQFQAFNEAITLTMSIIQDYQLGVLQIQKYLMFDEIKMLFYNQGTPFLLKKQLVKIMFHTFIEMIGETNANFQFSELELMLSTILSDLMLFLKYIDGLTMKKLFEGTSTSIISLTHQDEDQKQIFTKSRSKLADLIKEIEQAGYNASTNEDNKVQKSKLLVNTGPQISGPNQNAAQQQAAQLYESRRIVSDNSEYWVFLLSQSKWKGVQEGLLVFLQQIFSEIKKRNWNHKTYSETLTDQDSVFELLQLIKLALENIRISLNIIEEKNYVQNY